MLLIYNLLLLVCILLILVCLGFSLFFFWKANRTSHSKTSSHYFGRMLLFAGIGTFVLIMSLVVLSTASEMALP